jgi:hypothetical protein
VQGEDGLAYATRATDRRDHHGAAWRRVRVNCRVEGGELGDPADE